MSYIRGETIKINSKVVASWAAKHQCHLMEQKKGFIPPFPKHENAMTRRAKRAVSHPIGCFTPLLQPLQYSTIPPGLQKTGTDTPKQENTMTRQPYHVCIQFYVMRRGWHHQKQNPKASGALEFNVGFGFGVDSDFLVVCCLLLLLLLLLFFLLLWLLFVVICLFVCLAGWLVGGCLLFDWFVGWLGWLVGWLVGLVWFGLVWFGLLVGWLAGWLAGWLVGCCWCCCWLLFAVCCSFCCCCWMMLRGFSSGGATPASPKTNPNYSSKTLPPMALEA